MMHAAWDGEVKKSRKTKCVDWKSFKNIHKDEEIHNVPKRLVLGSKASESAQQGYPIIPSVATVCHQDGSLPPEQ